MTRVILFNILQLLASGYAITRGGAPERATGAALVAAALMTRLLGQSPSLRFASIEVGVLAVDLVLFAVLLLVALHADRWWPLWAVALHTLGTGAHLVRALDPGVERMVYAILAAAWSYPIMLLLVAGTFRYDRRARLNGSDRDWSKPRRGS